VKQSGQEQFKTIRQDAQQLQPGGNIQKFERIAKGMVATRGGSSVVTICDEHERRTQAATRSAPALKWFLPCRNNWPLHAASIAGTLHPR